jgi:uncharacterized protein (TIGR00730 family)
MRRVCVFCGSSAGHDALYREQAVQMGQALVAGGLGLVFGGGSVGLMGVIADTVLAAGGEVIGVIPEGLATRELLHPGVQPMHVVPSMHARKALMSELADAFIALPGGYGTFEETLEVITWIQLGIQRKPVGVLNVAGFYDPLVQLIEHAIATGFIRPEHRRLLVVDSDPQSLLCSLESHELPDVRKWIRRDES